jgi:hypothetical protein
MAKKKRAISQTPRVEWPESDVATLLAWYDYTLQHQDVDFDSTIVPHLGQTYTIVQIKRKLYQLWHVHGPYGTHRAWADDFKTQGSKCLHDNGLPTDIQKQVERSVQRFEDEYAAKQPSPAIRRLRSASRSIHFSPIREIALDNAMVARPRTPQKLRQRLQSNCLTPSAIKREIESPLGRHSPAKKSKQKHSKRVCAGRN